jgi:hypothetical protein
MKNYRIGKGAIVLLIAGVMILTSFSAIANTAQNMPNIYTEDTAKKTSQSILRAEIYNNGMGDLVGMLAAQDEKPLGGDLEAFPADDFILNTPARIDDVHWQGGYYNCQYAQGGMDYKMDWNITFYEDNGTGKAPGVVFAHYNFPNATIGVEFWYNTTDPSTGRETWYANYSVQLPDPIIINANKKYWISIYAVGLTFPQAGWCRHNETVLGIKFNEGVFKSAYFGFPDWTQTTDLVGEPNDFNFVLTGEEIQAPVLAVDIAGGIGLTATITNSGGADATNVEAEFNISGGLIIIPSGGAKTVSVGTISKDGGTGTGKCFVLGIGKPIITVDVTCDEGATASATFEPTFVLLFFIL